MDDRASERQAGRDQVAGAEGKSKKAKGKECPATDCVPGGGLLVDASALIWIWPVRIGLLCLFTFSFCLSLTSHPAARRRCFRSEICRTNKAASSYSRSDVSARRCA